MNQCERNKGASSHKLVTSLKDGGDSNCAKENTTTPPQEEISEKDKRFTNQTSGVTSPRAQGETCVEATTSTPPQGPVSEKYGMVTMNQGERKKEKENSNRRASSHKLVTSLKDGGDSNCAKKNTTTPPLGAIPEKGEWLH